MHACKRTCKTYMPRREHLAARVQPGFLSFFRAFLGVLLLLPLMFKWGPSIFKTAHPKLQIFRGFIGSGGLLCFFCLVRVFAPFVFKALEKRVAVILCCAGLTPPQTWVFTSNIKRMPRKASRRSTVGRNFQEHILFEYVF